MHVVITGANGFIGKHLTVGLLNAAKAKPADWPITRLTVVDLALDHIPQHPLIKRIPGSFAGTSTMNDALSTKADLVFHLASVPSGRTESDTALGLDVNVQGTYRLLEALKAQGNNPVLIFASSIAVYGKPQVPLVTDDTAPTPTLTYGAHKVIGEVLINDYVRRGWVRGCSLRLPGIVTRPPEPNGAVSIFFSDLIRELSHGQPFTCPTDENARTWLMSIGCCIANMMRAAKREYPEHRTFMLPPLHVRLGDLVTAIGEEFGVKDVHKLVTWKKDDWVQFNFGSYPPVELPRAKEHGFRSDADLRSLVRNSMV